MANLGDMVVRIVGDTKKFDESLTKSKSKMTSFGVGVAAVITAVISAAVVVGKAAKQFLDYGSAIYDASQKTGLSTDAIQEWKFIAEQTGTTLEAVTGAVGMMTRGLQANAETYKDLGIEVKNADGTFRSTTDIFNDTIKTLSAMTDETERDQMAFKLLGRSAQSLIPILNSGAEGIAEMRKQAHDMGIVLDEEAISNSDKLGDSTDALTTAFKSAAASMFNEMAPALIAVANGLTSVIMKTVAAKENFKAYEAFTGGAALALKDLEKSLRFVAEERATLERELAAGLAAGRNVAGISARLDVIKTQEAELRKLVKAEAEAVKYAQLKAEADAKAALAAADRKKELEDLDARTIDSTELIITAENDVDRIRRENYENYLRISKEMSDLNADMVEEDKKKYEHWAAISDDLRASEKEAREKELKERKEYNENVFSLAKDLAQSLAGLYNQIADNRVSALEREMEAALEAAGDDADARAQIEEDFQKKIGDVKYKAAVSSWQLSLASATADAVAAIMKAYASAPIPLNLIPVGLQAAANAIQIGTLLAAKPVRANFAEGGVVQPVPGGVQATVAEAGMAEAIIPLDRLDRMLENAGSVGGGGDMTRLIVNLDSRPLLDKIFSATRNRTVLIDSGAVV